MMFSGEGKTVCVFFLFLSGEDELSKETHVSFNDIVKFSGRREDTEEEWESSAEREGRELKIEIKFKKEKNKKKEKHKEAASRRTKQGQTQDGMWDKEMRRRDRCEKWTERWVTGSPRWIGCENKEGLCDGRRVRPSSFPQRLQNHLLYTFPPAHSQRNTLRRLQWSTVMNTTKLLRSKGARQETKKENQLNTPNEGSSKPMEGWAIFSPSSSTQIPLKNTWV